MDFFLIFVDVLAILVVISTLLILDRNENVIQFRLHIVDLIFDGNKEPHEIEKLRMEFPEDVSYRKTLYSFKKLKLENFYTKEQISRLYGENNCKKIW